LKEEKAKMHMAACDNNEAITVMNNLHFYHLLGAELVSSVEVKIK